MNQNKTIDAVDPIGLSLPEEREVWCANFIGAGRWWPHGIACHLEMDYTVRTTTEAECILFWAQSGVPGCGAIATTIKESINLAKKNKRDALLLITYADGRWLVLAEYRVTEAHHD